VDGSIIHVLDQGTVAEQSKSIALPDEKPISAVGENGTFNKIMKFRVAE